MGSPGQPALLRAGETSQRPHWPPGEERGNRSHAGPKPSVADRTASSRVPRCLSGLATWAALAGNATGAQLVGAGKTGSWRAPHSQLLPRHWDRPGSLPQGVAEEPEPTPLNLSPHCWPKPPPARQREPAISPHLEVRLLNLRLGSQGWAALTPEPLT